MKQFKLVMFIEFIEQYYNDIGRIMRIKHTSLHIDFASVNSMKHPH